MCDKRVREESKQQNQTKHSGINKQTELKEQLFYEGVKLNRYLSCRVSILFRKLLFILFRQYVFSLSYLYQR